MSGGCSPLIPDSSIGVWLTPPIMQIPVLMDASLHPHPRSPARCGEGSAAQGAQDRHREPDTGSQCACFSRKSRAFIALQGLEDSRVVSSGLHNAEASIPCLPRSKAIATLSTCSIAQPWGQVFLPAILKCLQFIPGDNHYLLP